MHAADRDDAIACVLAGGDDYELCFTASEGERGRIVAIAAECALPLTRIGHVTSAPGLHVLDERGVPLRMLPRAFDHFA
jgi:thiamine-monophosphate kinase